MPIALLLLVSCDNLDLAPENKFTDFNYWTSVDKVQTLLNTAYSPGHSLLNL